MEGNIFEQNAHVLTYILLAAYVNRFFFFQLKLFAFNLGYNIISVSYQLLLLISIKSNLTTCRTKMTPLGFLTQKGKLQWLKLGKRYQFWLIYLNIQTFFTGCSQNMFKWHCSLNHITLDSISFASKTRKRFMEKAKNLIPNNCDI